MKNRILLCLLLLSSLTSVVYADECDDPKSSDQIAQCLGNDLRDSDAKINASYKELMSKLSDTDKASLRQAQRNWIKDRDSVCHLDTKESNREKWYQALLKDYVKTVCVTRYTRQRTSELDAMLAKQSSQGNAQSGAAAPPPPSVSQSPDATYDQSSMIHANGKWYFEIAVNYGEVVKIEPCVLTAGIWDKQDLTGILDNIRPRDRNKEVVRYGFAVDLDNGKLYVSENGVWENGEPGSNRGHDLKLGRSYYSFFMVSADNVAPYLFHKAIVPNLGDWAMAYALPAGYRPWKNKTIN